MTRVDFYLLTHPDPVNVICRLIDKAYQRGHRIFVFADQIRDAERIDEALWTFRDDSFIPHLMQNEGPNPPPLVQLGCEEPSQHFSDILVNLSASIPTWYRRFQRVLEIVPSDETAKAASRERFRLYRNDRCELQTHSID